MNFTERTAKMIRSYTFALFKNMKIFLLLSEHTTEHLDAQSNLMLGYLSLCITFTLVCTSLTNHGICIAAHLILLPL